MRVLEHVEQLRLRVKANGLYLRMSKKTGISDSWLQKFAVGKITNPTAERINELEKFYPSDEQGQHDSPAP